MATAYLANPSSPLHDPGPGHPEQPARFEAALRGLEGHALKEFVSRHATEDELKLCHSANYIVIARRDVASGQSELSTGDTQINRCSFDVARDSVGTALTAIDLVAQGAAQNAFCVVRPPGHHASQARGMGFCLFNTVAIAARYAQSLYAIERVLIADWDVHHGNGTQDIFYEDGSVFFFSTHQSPWYPGTGAASETGSGRGAGATLNCPFPAGAGRREILGAFEERLLPAMETFRPELVLISAGFDSRQDDPLGNFRLNDSDFADLTWILLAVADQYAKGRLVSVLEGGYNLEGLERAVRAHAGALQSAARGVA